MLRQCLSVELVYPCFRAVGRDNHQRHMLIPRLGYGRCQIEQCRTRRDTYGHGLRQRLRQSQREKAGAALIGHGIALDSLTLVQIVYDGGVSRTGTNHRMTHMMRHEQRGQNIDVIFVGVHFFRSSGVEEFRSSDFSSLIGEFKSEGVEE